MFLQEYITKQNLRKVGYYSDIGELDVLTAEAFMIISNEFSRLEDKEIRKASR